MDPVFIALEAERKGRSPQAEGGTAKRPGAQPGAGAMDAPAIIRGPQNAPRDRFSLQMEGKSKQGRDAGAQTLEGMIRVQGNLTGLG